MTEYKLKFDEVKDNFPILKVCERLGIELKRQPNGQFRTKCPLHKSDDARWVRGNFSRMDVFVRCPVQARRD